MAESQESKRLLRTALVVVAVGVVVLVPLAWFALRKYNDTLQQKVMSANEAAALYSLEQISAAEHLYFQANGEYATIQKLSDAGVLQTTWTGDPPVSHGYIFAVHLTPKTDAQAPSYIVNADPQIDRGRAATGRRHFFISSDVVGVRMSEGRPATAADPPRQSVQEY